MKYIIMCGGVYQQWTSPRHLLKINNETIIERTIRLLKENNITDIAISTNYKQKFQFLNIPILQHNNSYNVVAYNDFTGYWVDAFYLINEPVCYLFGDVVFSDQAIKIIVNTPTEDIQFFASAPPFSKQYIKSYAEPFGLKVNNTQHLQESIILTKKYQDQNRFNRKPIMWELWQVIKHTRLNKINYNNYTIINDYTCDIDNIQDLEKIKIKLGIN